MTALRRAAPRFNVACLVDDLSGMELTHAVLTGTSVRLSFRHLTANKTKVLNVPASTDWNEVIATQRIEPVDNAGRSRLLGISPDGLQGLRAVLKSLRDRERNRRAARAKKADVTIFGVNKSSSQRWGTVCAIDAAPCSATLKYSPTIFLKSMRLNNRRLELVVEVGDKTLTAALQDPTAEHLEAFAWGAASGRLMWFGLLEGMKQPEAIRVGVEDLEGLHQALKVGHETSKNGVIDS